MFNVYQVKDVPSNGQFLNYDTFQFKLIDKFDTHKEAENYIIRNRNLFERYTIIPEYYFTD